MMDSVNKYGSDGVPFTGQIDEIKPPEQQLQEAIDAFVPVIQRVFDTIAPAVEQCTRVITQLWDALLKSYPDKRIVHLAFHHKKEKVRKKNRKRIVKYINKAVNRDDQSRTESEI